MDASAWKAAAEALAGAEALLIGAGAGMGVDSGLPDFRGTEGFWQAYPPIRRLGLDFAAMANPDWFERDPAFAWGFYGHRLELYRATKPHAGFELLRRAAARMRHGAFVFTSNVDGQFQRAGFPEERIAEAHGAIDWLQCLHDCARRIIRADPWSVTVDLETLRARAPLPHCPDCGGLARPNILMFNDGGWNPSRSDQQNARLDHWLRNLDGARLVVIECGAGTAIPTVRRTCEEVVRQGGTLIRLNTREPRVPAGHIGLPVGALEGIQRLAGPQSAD